MIIYGTKGVTSTPEKGTFFCPQCGPDSPYSGRSIRRFFTLYFIPLIPLNKLGEYVECMRCKGTYERGVLEINPAEIAEEIEAQYQTGIRKVMIAMMLADGEIDDSELATIQMLNKELAGRDLDADLLRKEISSIQASGGELKAVLEGFDGMLNDHGKEKVIEAAFLVANADGEFHESEQALLVEISDILRLSRAHLKGLIDTLATGARIPDPTP